MTLFERGDVKLSSGELSWWKVECDALTEEDWRTLADLAIERLGLDFDRAVGVYRGGLPFAHFLNGATNRTGGGTIVVDDVLTTGRSILQAMEYHATDRGVVVFARGPVPAGVQALWTLS